jgi:hypothetical protein
VSLAIPGMDASPPTGGHPSTPRGRPGSTARAFRRRRPIPSVADVMTSLALRADSHLSDVGSQPLAHLAILAVVVGVGVAVYLLRRGRS